MDRQQTCKRCSITRVNALCALYEEAFGENASTSLVNLKNLKALVQLAQSRGLADGRRILTPGLRKSQLRTLAWNISSVLFNDDLLRLGIPLNGRGRP